LSLDIFNEQAESMSEHQPQLPRSLDEQRAEYARRRGLAMPLAGLIVWTMIGIAGAFLPPILAVWSLFIGAGCIARPTRKTSTLASNIS